MVMLNTKSDILNKLFFKELQELIRKYNEIDSNTQALIENTISNINDEELSEYLINNPKKMDEVITHISRKEIDIDVIPFFLWYNSQIRYMNMENAIINYETLVENGYVEIEEYLVYRSDRYLKEYAKKALQIMLDEESSVDRLFDKDTIIDFWINKTDKYEVINEIIENDDLEEVLEMNPEYAFKANSGIEYSYSIIEY